MRILYLVFYYFPRASAATWSTFALTERLAKNNEVYLVFPNVGYPIALGGEEVAKALSGSHAIHHRVPRFKIPEGPAQTIAPLFVFLDAMKTGRRCDAVVCQFQPHHFVFLAGIAVGKLLGLPVVARANDVYREMGEKLSPIQRINLARRRVYNAINEWFVGLADEFLVVCEENRDTLISRVGELPNIRISHNGVDPEEFQNLDRVAARKSLGIEEEQRIVLFTGRFSGEEYRLDVLLEAYSLLKSRHPEALLYLVGDSLPKTLEGEALRLGVRVVGHVPRRRIAEFLAASDVCIGPLGRTQAIPLKVLEYMVAGRPIVTGSGSVSRELAIDEVNCLAPAMEPVAIADAITRLLDDEGLRERIIRNASETVKRFYWDNIASELEETLHKVVDGYKKGNS